MLNNLYNWNARKLTPKADDAKVVPRLRLFSAVKTYLYILLATVVVTVILTASVRLTEDPPLPLMGMAPVCSGSIAFITMAQAVIVFILFLACVGILWNSRYASLVLLCIFHATNWVTSNETAMVSTLRLNSSGLPPSSPSFTSGGR